MDNVTPFPTNKSPPETGVAGLTENEAKRLLEDLQGKSGAEIDGMLADHDAAARKRLRVASSSGPLPAYNAKEVPTR